MTGNTTHEALEAVREERGYQNNKWTDNDAHPAKFLILLHNYVHMAMERQSGLDSLQDSEETKHDLRKIAAIAVRAMELVGVARRE